MRPARLNWEEQDSAAFLEYGDCFVPERELQIEIFRALIPEPGNGALVVELCCGEGLLSEAILRRYPACRVLALDGSAAMRERAARRLSPFGKRAEVREFDLAQTNWRRFDQPLHACLSAYAVHHLDGPEKRELFRDIARLLAPGGMFAIADLIEPETGIGRGVAAQQWDDAVKQRSLGLRGDLSAYDYFIQSGWNYFSAPGPDPVDHPSGLREQLEWLREAGFEAVDVHWMKAGMALFGGRKGVQA
jgi:tRNA (cmo5U34)-methyltransferase